MPLKLSKEELTALGFESIDDDPIPGLYTKGSICAEKKIGNTGLYFSYNDVVYLDAIAPWHSFDICIRSHGTILRVVKEINSKKQFHKLEDALKH